MIAGVILGVLLTLPLAAYLWLELRDAEAERDYYEQKHDHLYNHVVANPGMIRRG